MTSEALNEPPVGQDDTNLGTQTRPRPSSPPKLPPARRDPAQPRVISPVPDTTDVSEYEFGLNVLGVGATDQGYNIARIVSAARHTGLPLYRRVAVQVPRRSAKTTTLTAVALGRMATRPGYRIMSTAQSGKIARAMWRETVRALDAHYVSVPEDERPYTVRISNGTEELRWENGSVWIPVTPSPLSYRSQAADLLIFEEAGHIRPDVAAELRAGALPTQDTRPDGQAWIVGTPGDDRVGLLWDALQSPTTGKVDYAADEHEDPNSEAVWWRVHPGLASGMTTIEVLRERHDEMPPEQFAAEYLGLWPSRASDAALDVPAWHAAGGEFTERPARVGLAYDVAPDGTCASLVAAWRDADGTAVFEVLAHRAGTQWLAAAAATAAAKYRQPVWHDRIGANADADDQLQRAKPRPQVKRLGTVEIVGAAQRIAEAVATGGVRHAAQADLDAAVENAGWRPAGQSGRAFARRDRLGAPVTPLVAASIALWGYDNGRDRQRVQLVA